MCVLHTQVYLCDDRLCYHQPEPIGAADATDAYAGSPTASSRSKAAAAAAMVSASMDASSSAHADLPLVGHYGHSLTLSTTAASLAALAAGEVRYIALDRIPVRPLPHRQHEFDPCERSHPDVGVTIVDDRCGWHHSSMCSIATQHVCTAVAMQQQR